MPASLNLQRLERPGYSLELFIPDAQEVQLGFTLQKKLKHDIPFPHWTKIWPAALAMADFIHEHPEFVQNKKVLELAAGVGLPSFVAARYAASVCCSDYLDEAVAAMAESVQHLQLPNISCKVLDWNRLPEDLSADVLLLSDINYDPDQFDRLYEVLQSFLRSGTLVLLATPQRLMAKPFIESLLPFCRQQFEKNIFYQQQYTMVSLLLM